MDQQVILLHDNATFPSRNADSIIVTAQDDGTTTLTVWRNDEPVDVDTTDVERFNLAIALLTLGARHHR